MTTTYEKVRPRVGYWDLAKGIAILLCVVGHQPNLPLPLRRIIFTFHMPLFFIANAYFISRYDVLYYAKRSARSLLLPYTTVCLVSTAFEMSRSRVEDIFPVFKQGMVDMLAGMSKISGIFTQFRSVWLVWFVICLFFARLLYIAAMSYLKRFPVFISLAVMIAFSVMGVFIGTHVAFLPWSLDVALASMVFMWVGDQMHKSQVIETVLPSIWLSVCGLLWVVLTALGYQIELATRSYPGYGLSFLCAIAGSMTVVSVSMFIEKIPFLSSFLIWCGRHSMVILSLHCLEMRFIRWNMPFPSAITESWLLSCAIKLLIILSVAWCLVLFLQSIPFYSKREAT